MLATFLALCGLTFLLGLWCHTMLPRPTRPWQLGLAILLAVAWPTSSPLLLISGLTFLWLSGLWFVSWAVQAMNQGGLR